MPPPLGVIEHGPETGLLHQRRNVEQSAGGGGHRDPRPRLDVGGHQATAPVNGPMVRRWVPASGHRDLDGPAPHALESPQRRRRQV
jgi:hypothetical protein